jgi:transposase
MKNKIHDEVTFKAYNQHQLNFLPPSLEELIPEGHPVRTVNRIVDEIDLTPLIETYKSGGTSSYHPVMLLKVVLYAYLRNIYSTPKMEEALTENIHFMWLAGNNKPDHNTLARFRTTRLKGSIEYIFQQTVHLLVDTGLISLKEVFIDGTKIEANANKYSFVWGKAITYNKKRIVKQLDELVDYASSVAKSEESLGSVSFEEISSEKVRTTIDQINERLQGKEIDPKVKQKLRYAKKQWPDSLERYEK